MKLLLLVLTLSGFASAEVTEKNASGFLVKHVATVAASPTTVYETIVNVGSWWESSHTWSGSAKNLSIVAKGGGCFCEKLPDGGEVQHAMVVYAAPGKVLRLSGALGPMQGSGIAGVLTFELKPVGTQTEITVSYSAGGYFQGGIQAMAEPVNGMIGAQVAELVKVLGN